MEFVVWILIWFGGGMLGVLIASRAHAQSLDREFPNRKRLGAGFPKEYYLWAVLGPGTLFAALIFTVVLVAIERDTDNPT